MLTPFDSSASTITVQRERERKKETTPQTLTLHMVSTMPVWSPRKHRRYIVDVFGTPVTTIVTSAPSIVRKWLRSTRNFYRRYRGRLVVGLGVQWVPDTGYDDNPAATLQLCVGHRCLIFQLIHADWVPRLLRRFLSDPNNTFVGFWNHSDAGKLAISRHELEMDRPPLDLRVFAESKSTGESLAGASREDIVRECLGEEFKFESWISRSDWDDEKLSMEQVVQAGVEARAAFLIGTDIRAWQFS